jgi:hypothetical protein
MTRYVSSWPPSNGGDPCSGWTATESPRRAGAKTPFSQPSWRTKLIILPPDKLYAESFRPSARKFGLRITADKEWEF